jgi:hypothetical protein
MVTRCRYDSSRKKTLGLHREDETLRKQHLPYLLRKTGHNETTTKTDRTGAQGEGVQRSLHRVESAVIAPGMKVVVNATHGDDDRKRQKVMEKWRIERQTFPR